MVPTVDTASSKQSRRTSGLLAAAVTIHLNLMNNSIDRYGKERTVSQKIRNYSWQSLF